MASQRRFKSYDRCAFCRNKANSKEHLWADWISNFIPKTAEYTDSRSRTMGFILGELGIQTVRDVSRRQTGDTLSRRLRVVCLECNRGWMSRLQEANKQILIPYINKSWPTIRRENHRSLAAWASMTAAVIEHADYYTMAITAPQREELAKAQIPPSGFSVLVGDIDCDLWIGAYNHFGIGESKPKLLDLDLHPSTYALTPIYAQQSTAFAIGSLFFLVYSTSSQNFMLRMHNLFGAAEAHNLRILWPSPNCDILKPVKTHDQISSDQASRAFLSEESRRIAVPFWHAR